MSQHFMNQRKRNTTFFRRATTAPPLKSHTIRSTYHSNEGAFHYAFPGPASTNKNPRHIFFTRHEGRNPHNVQFIERERREMGDNKCFSFGSKVESRDDYYTRRYNIDSCEREENEERREMLEYLSYREETQRHSYCSNGQSHPQPRASREGQGGKQIGFYRTHQRQSIEEIEFFKFPVQPKKQAEYLTDTNQSTKQAEYLSTHNEQPSNYYEHLKKSANPWQDVTPKIAHSPDDIINSPPRLSRHRTTHRLKRERNLRDAKVAFPMQTRHYSRPETNPRISRSLAFHQPSFKHVGHPSLEIYRFRLPTQYLAALDQIVNGCEQYASTLDNGWTSDLYSLTKQDIALSRVPNTYNIAKPILSYINAAARQIYGIQTLRVDKKQSPHVLKYSGCHKGVQLHHDLSDITMNVMLSRSNEYEGGGTFFPDANENVRLEFGEFLLHRGSTVHGGRNITSGERYLLVIFTEQTQK